MCINRLSLCHSSLKPKTLLVWKIVNFPTVGEQNESLDSRMDILSQPKNMYMIYKKHNRHENTQKTLYYYTKTKIIHQTTWRTRWRQCGGGGSGGGGGGGGGGGTLSMNLGLLHNGEQGES